MRIPNKFNGYMSDGRRLYPDPATSAIIASALAEGTAVAAPTLATTAVAAPTLATAAGASTIPGLVGSANTLAGLSTAAPAATTALGTELGTTAALETTKQGIIQGAMEKQAAELAAKDVAQNQVIDAFSKGTSDLSKFEQFVPEASNTAPQLMSKGAPPLDPFTTGAPKGYELGSQAVPKVANTSPLSTEPSSFSNLYNPPELGRASFNPTEGLKNVPKDVVGDASLKMPNMPELTTAKAPPNALERGIQAASKFASDHPYITTGGIMLAQNMMQPSYSSPPKKKYGSSGPGAEYTAPSATRYTSKFETTSNYAVGGPVEQMSAENAISGNMMYPQSQLHTPMYSNPMVQRPMPSNVINAGIDAPTDPYTGEQRFADGGNVTGSGNLNLNVPLNFGGPGIGGANGYATAGGEQAGTGIAQGYTPAPAQQIDASASPAAANTQSALTNMGRAFVPKVQWGDVSSVMGGGAMPSTYTVGDQAADDWVKSQAKPRGPGMRGQQYKDQIEDLYQKYYRGYADGGSVQGYASGGKMSAFERMMKEEEARKKKADAQAEADLEKGQSVAAKGIKPYSRTQSTNSPYAAAVKELQAMGKKYGIQMAAPAKTNVDLMGDQDQIEYAANGGIMHGLGGYSDGGRLLKGPGDGVSDSIPAVIGNKQPARLADGEFVIPARIVSELGNGSTEAGARKLYAMMERVQKQRRKTVGKNKVAVNSKADKHLPA